MLKQVQSLIGTWKYIWRHPLASRNRPLAFRRWLQWQLVSRVAWGDVVVPFVASSRLVVHSGMTGATGNIYTGLHEFEDMAFALHLLRPSDLFVDAGANVGVYTILGATAGASCVSVEPLPGTHSNLLANIRINGLGDSVRTYQVALGATPGIVLLTSNLDAMNHVLAAAESASGAIDVPVVMLDELLRNEEPVLLKVDVEGYETEVFKGAMSTLTSPKLLALIVELNESGERYGASERELSDLLGKCGFQPYTYSPYARQLQRCAGHKNSSGGNTLFVRDFDEVTRRLSAAQAIEIFGTRI